MNLVQQKQTAGGFKFFMSENKSNVRLGEAKQQAIIKAIDSSYTEGVYKLDNGKVKRQLLNGNAEFLTYCNEENEYYFN